MHTFRVLDQQIGLVPAAIARTLGAIDTARGREDAFRMQRPQVLDALVNVARIQSTEASNAIEDVVAPRKRIEALVELKTKFSITPEGAIVNRTLSMTDGGSSSASRLRLYQGLDSETVKVPCGPVGTPVSYRLSTSTTRRRWPPRSSRSSRSA